MSTNADDFIDLIDRRLDQVLKYSRGWGGVDALEPVVLMLLVLRASAGNPMSNDQLVIGEYRNYLTNKLGGGAADLRARLGDECSEERMVEILREYVERIRCRAEPGA